MKAYTGFDKDLKCRGFQYESGKEYEEEESKLCKIGFQACENPLDTFRYYAPTDSRYCEVDVADNGERNSEGTKICGKHIKIGAEIGMKGVINAGVRFVFDKCESATEKNASGKSGNAAASGNLGNAAASGWSGNAAASGDLGNAAASGASGNAAASGARGNAAASGARGNAAASGEMGNAAASGWRGNAAASGRKGTAVATGEQGSSAANGEQCLAVAWGKDSRAKGKLGTWLVVTEHDSGMILNAKLVQVDGLTVKEETWYTLKNGELVEA